MQHQPVLLQEVIEHLAIKPDGIYIDATFGRGGHSQKILEHLGPNGQLLAMDKDHSAIAAAKEQGFYQDPRFSIHQGSFTQLLALVRKNNVLAKVNGILLDLGVSSPQLDDSTRGFSFLLNGPLDMRMDQSQSLDAQQWLNTATTAEIREVIKEYGEERYALRIAKAIVAFREKTPLTTTKQLAEVVSQAHPRWEKHKHPATRTFQAIRIFINSELEDLKNVLEQSLEALVSGGRLLVISFHSLEDRIVKNFISMHGSLSRWPRGIPLTASQLQATLRIKRINSAIRPSEKEIQQNKRSRSAILRIMEKIE